MTKTFAAFVASVALGLAAPAFANPGNGGNPCGSNCGNGNVPGGSFEANLTGGAFVGGAHSVSSGGSFAASGGIAHNGNGGSFVRNEQSAGQLSGAFASYEGASNGRLTKGTVITETFTDGFSESRTLTRDHGVGTIGAGAGFSSNWGEAEAGAGFLGGGFATNW